MDILLIFACLYMAFTNVQTLSKIPFAEWEVVQYAMAVLTVILVLVGALKGWQFYNKKKNQKAAQAEKALEEQAASRAQADVDTAVAGEDVEPLRGKASENWEEETADFNYTLVDENPPKKDNA